MAAVESTLHCSFCAKSQHEVAKLIAGPGVYICDQCIGLCDEILVEDRRDAPPTGAAGDGASEEALLRHLHDLARRSDELVEQLRGRDVAWERIAEALKP